MGLSGAWSLRLYWASAMHECAAWGRELLALVWGYRLALSVISALFGFASAAIAPSFIDPQTDAAAYALGVTVYATLVFLVSLPVLVVFAQAGISAQPHPCVLLFP